MKFDILPIINDEPVSIKPFRKIYYENGYMAKLVYKKTKWVYLRTRLAEAQNWKCCFCGCYMTEKHGHKNSVTVEHVTAKSQGGTDDPSNLAASCHRCNNNRGTTDAMVFDHRKQTATSARVQLEAKVRKYLKRAQTFAEIGWGLNENIRSFEDWFRNLRLNAEGRKMFMDQWNQLTMS